MIKTYLIFGLTFEIALPFEKTLYNIKNQIIWGNTYLKINNKTLFLKHWIDAKLILINDIYTQSGEIDTKNILTLKIKKTTG